MSRASCLRRLSAAALLGVGTLLAGCGDEASKPSPPPPPGAAVEPMVRSADPAVSKVQEYVDRRSQAKDIDKSAPDWRSRLPMRPKVTTFDAAKTYVWTLATDVGSLQIKLRAAEAPDHVAAVLYLTLLGFYDGLAIHTIVPGKAFESGDPADDGKGSPGWAISPETSTAKHDRRGLVSAISHGPSTDDSKFRVTFGADSAIDPVCTIFGEVEAGLDTLKRLEDLGSPDGKPKKHVTIQKATISIR